MFRKRSRRTQIITQTATQIVGETPNSALKRCSRTGIPWGESLMIPVALSRKTIVVSILGFAQTPTHTIYIKLHTELVEQLVEEIYICVSINDKNTRLITQKFEHQL